MKLSDEKVMEFLSKSPLKTFPAMLDALRHLEDNSINADAEYELFNEPLGDNEQAERTIRMPEVGGITANALLAFMGHAHTFHLVRRRPRTLDKLEPEPEVRVFYQLTPSGSYVLKILEALTDVSSLAER